MQGKSFLITIFTLALVVCVGIGAAVLIKHNRSNYFISNYQQADNLFNEGQYNEALSVFEKIKNYAGGEKRYEILYKIGSCYKKTGQPDKAEEAWKIILNSSDLTYRPVIYWEIAQQRLKEKDFAQAEIYYSKILDEFSSHPLAEDAILGPVDIYIGKKEPEKAKEYCINIIETTKVPRIKEIAIDKLGDINTYLLFSSIPTQESENYIIEMGDSLTKISKEFNTTVDLLQKSNNIKGSFIKAGQTIKVTPGKFSILIDVKNNELFLNYDGKLFKRYKIASGASESPTPPGEFVIKEKIKDPSWYPPQGGVVPPGSATNLLGSRWMGLWESGRKTSYGIHEAIDPSDIGKHMSNGCIRMLKEDLEELYDIVPIGTPVTIR